jgi:hypothetical protein
VDAPPVKRVLRTFCVTHAGTAALLPETLNLVFLLARLSFKW